MPHNTSAHAIASVPTSIAAFIGTTERGAIGTPMPVSSFARFAAAFGGMSAEVWPGTTIPRHPLAFAVNDFFANGGSRAIIVRVDGHPEEGLSALDSAGHFNLLVFARHAPRMNVVDVARLVTKAGAYCARRRAFFIVDPPDSWDHPDTTRTFANTVVHDIATLRSATAAPSNVAVFYPRILKQNAAANGRIQAFSAAGAIAGVIARTDAQRGVWKAPAGIDATLTGSTGLTVALNAAEIALFESAGVNCLRTFPMRTPVVWGSRTLANTGGYKYIAVRRFSLFIEQSLDQGTQWAVFEPNDETLWGALRLSVGSFMESLFRQGALAGNTPDQAYFVTCDSTTMTQSQIARGIVNIDVGFAPLKPAEFVVIQISQLATATPSPH